MEEQFQKDHNGQLPWHTVVKAFVQVSVAARHAFQVQAEKFHENGVKTILVPNPRGKKERADFMIKDEITEIMTFSRNPYAIGLVSGDGDFSSQLSMLRAKQVKLYTITPENSKADFSLNQYKVVARWPSILQPSPDEGLIDYILDFLESSSWSVPLKKYLDEICLVFDSCSQENKLLYTKLHDDYREMMESMLESALDELEVTHENFVRSLSKRAKSWTQEERKRKVLVEKIDDILRLDDFEYFRSKIIARQKEILAKTERLKRNLKRKGSSSNITTNNRQQPKYQGQSVIHDRRGEGKKQGSTWQKSSEDVFQEYMKSTEVVHGIVAGVRRKRGFGFIAITGVSTNLYFHFNQVVRKNAFAKRYPQRGDAVTFFVTHARRKNKGSKFEAAGVRWGEGVKPNSPQSEDQHIAAVLDGKYLTGVITMLDADQTYGAISSPIFSKMIIFYTQDFSKAEHDARLSPIAPGSSVMFKIKKGATVESTDDEVFLRASSVRATF
mmetsp:Transcript_30806/g.43127  ORF Transcript_30806/g.43127 Transcript_30806/m.43127 type:complete len:499 (-) Transcript_30806:196-1692(-)|eukprot:jgi/Bigna1/88333/estExt_fgenesh1_pg.C_300178